MDCEWEEEGRVEHIPESSLDAAHVILAPIPPYDFLLPHGHPLPTHSHHGDGVLVILVEDDLQIREVPRGPAAQSPFLDDLCGCFQGDVFAADVAAEELEFPACVGAFEYFRGGTREGGEPVGGGEGGEEFGGGGAEFFGRGQGGCVDGGVVDRLCGGGFGAGFADVGLCIRL